MIEPPSGCDEQEASPQSRPRASATRASSCGSPRCWPRPAARPRTRTAPRSPSAQRPTEKALEVMRGTRPRRCRPTPCRRPGGRRPTRLGGGRLGLHGQLQLRLAGAPTPTSPTSPRTCAGPSTPASSGQAVEGRHRRHQPRRRLATRSTPRRRSRPPAAWRGPDADWTPPRAGCSRSPKALYENPELTDASGDAKDATASLKVKAFPYASTVKEAAGHGRPAPQTPFYNDVALAISRTLHPDDIDPRRTSDRLRDAIDRALKGRDCCDHAGRQVRAEVEPGEAPSRPRPGRAELG